MVSDLLQRKLHTLKPEYQVRFNEEQREFWGKTKYEGPLSEQMPKFRQYAMMHVSPAELAINYKYWKYVTFGAKKEVGEYELNLNDIVTFLQACQKRTLIEWITLYGPVRDGIPAAKEYEEFMICIEEMEEFVNPIIDAFAEKLVDRLLTTQHLDISGQNGNRNSGEYKKKSIELPS